MSNPYYYTCKTCGSNLDPGEICTDCFPPNKIDKNAEEEKEHEASPVDGKEAD